MAEAMCGPANPLQQFKQQTTFDRSLQQDRLISRQNNAQGFRTMDFNAGLHDPEFEAFQAGMDMNHMQPFHHGGNLSVPSQASSWASDFQRLNITSPSAFQQQQQQQQQQPFSATSESSSWAKSFAGPRVEIAPRSQTASPSPQAFQQRARYGLTGFQSSFAQPAYGPMAQSGKGKAPMMEEFDDAAFERAFNQAREDMVLDAEQELTTADTLMDTVEGDQQSTFADSIQPTDADWRPEQMIHSSDIEHRPALELGQEKEVLKQRADDDALAMTAQELLEKIEHNQTEKFKNSQFLGLMRKLRDREVRVEGDQMVETANATASTTSLADATLNATSSAHTASFPSHQSQYYYNTITPLPGSNFKIPPSEQDYDSGRTIDPVDGQAVVDLLNQRGVLTDDMGTSNPTHVSSSPSQTKSWPYMSFETDGFITP